MHLRQLHIALDNFTGFHSWTLRTCIQYNGLWTLNLIWKTHSKTSNFQLVIKLTRQQ